MEETIEQFAHGVSKEVIASYPAEKAAILARQAGIAKTLQERGSRHSDGLGQHMARIDARAYWRWERERPGCWQDKQWVDDFLRDNPAYCAVGYKPKKRL